MGDHIAELEVIMSSQYSQLGIDAQKRGVKQAFRGVIDNDYPLAFCNIVQDHLNPGYVITQHVDGDGSKFIQRVLHYNETGDVTIFRGAVDDALSMNTGDVAASGFVYEYFVNDVLNLNAANVPKDLVMEQVASRFLELKLLYLTHEILLKFLGGETADLPDQVKSVAFDIAVGSRVRETGLIKGNVQVGDVIYGMASDGRAVWEDSENSGIMSNGLTMARIKLMSRIYNAKYPELIRADKPFAGRFLITQSDGLKVSQAILSPTRQWALIIRRIVQELVKRGKLDLLHGVVMNTGGGVSKILNIGQNIRYNKVMPPPPQIFHLIQGESGEDWKHMFTSFNCGVGIDIVGSSRDGILEEVLKAVSLWSGIDLFRLGECTASQKEDNEVRVNTPFGIFNY